MNVIRMENAKVRPTRGRSRGKGKGRDFLYWKTNVERPIRQPKYQSSFSETPQQSSSLRTPSTKGRTPGMPSSSSARITSSGCSSNLQYTTSTSDILNSTVIMAITSGRGDARSEVGMAAIDVKYPHLIISQISDTQTYANTLTKIHLFNPVEILMPETMCGDEPRKKLFTTIRSKFKEILITPIWRSNFNEENGLDRIKTHCADEFSSLELFVKEKYYALAATAALLKYVEQIQHIIYEPKSMQIEFQASQGATMIDVESALNLELVSSQGPQKNHNLFSSLNRCVTPMGRRLLRSSILQPLCDKDAILERQACVSELVENRNLHTILQPIIKQLCGTDRLLGLSMRTTLTKECAETAERNLNYILLLKTCLEVIPQLSAALDTASSSKFVKIRENLKNPRFQIMREQILDIIQTDARSVNGYTSANMQRCFALKSGMNDILDVSRQTYCELMEQTTTLVDSLAHEYNLQLTVACNASYGYHIRMPVPKQPNFNISDLPNVFVEVQKKRSTLFMTTDLLMSLSQQCKNARNELYILSSCILEALIASLRNQVTCLFQFSEDIAELDLIMSIARISGIPDYVKPTFGQSLRIIDSKHPIVDLLGTELPRPNNIEASVSHNFCNITGPNMSGKSTYLKQVVLLHIMAQIGCYLPAKEATLRIANRIFCRLCPSHEDIESNASSFVQEIKEIEYVLQFITPTSLVILDEICRSTNSEEGAPIAFAICETLLQSTAFIFNCTHFIFLTKLTELYPNAVNYFFVCEPNELDKWGLKYTHKLRKGITCAENYGISAASASRLPKPVIEKAKQLVGEIAPHFKPLPLVRAPKLSWQKDCYDCVSKFMELILSDELTHENIRIAVEPLRGHKNLKVSEKSALLNDVLQKNFQKVTSERFQGQTQTNFVQHNKKVSNCPENIVVSDFEAIDIDQIKEPTFNALQNTETLNLHQTKSLESSLNPFQSQHPFHKKSTNPSSSEKQENLPFKMPTTINPIPNLESNLNPFQSQHPFHKKSTNSSSSEKQENLPFKMPTTINPIPTVGSNLNPFQSLHPFHKKSTNPSTSEKREENFPFKMPTTINPIKKIQKAHKLEHIKHQEAVKTTDINCFNFFKNRTSLSKALPASLSTLRKSTLYDFGFSKGKVDNKKYSSYSKNFQDLSEEDVKSLTSTSSSKLQTSNLSSLVEDRTSGNTSSSTLHSELNNNFNPHGTPKKLKPQKSNLSNSSTPRTPRNWLQKNILYASIPLSRPQQSEQNDDFKKASSPKSPFLSNSVKSLRPETESRYSLNENDSKKFPRQNTSNFSSPQSSTSREAGCKISAFEKHWHSFSNYSNSRSSNQKEDESLKSPFNPNRDNISSRSFNFTPPQSPVPRDVGCQSSIFEKNLQSDQDNNSRTSLSQKHSFSNLSPLVQKENESQNLFKTDEDNISKRSQLLTPSSFLKLSENSQQLNASRGSQTEHEDRLSLNMSRDSVQSNTKSRSSPFKSKLHFNREEDLKSPRLKQQNFLNLNIFKHLFQEEIETRNKKIKADQNYETENFDTTELHNPRQANLNIFKFLAPENQTSKEPNFGDPNRAWTQHEMNYFKKSLSQSPSVSNLANSRNRCLEEMESESVRLKKLTQHAVDHCKKSLSQSSSVSNLAESRNSCFEETESEDVSPKKLKLDINPDNQAESQNCSNYIIEDTLSSFNTANLSFMLNKPLKNPISSQNCNNPLNSSQNKLENPKPYDFTDLVCKKKGSINLSEKIEDSETSSSDIEISEIESVLDDDTLQIDDFSNFSTPNPGIEKNNVSTISSEDTLEAANNIRSKEDEIFREIEENANDGEMFLQRIFNSPLSVPCSDELCSCSYSSNTRDTLELRYMNLRYMKFSERSKN